MIVFSLTTSLALGACWAGWAGLNRYFADPESGIVRAHAAMLKACDLGDVLLLGDSTATADLLPAEIGPHVRALAMGGASPLENFYMLRQALRCRNAPRAVVFAYAPASLTARPDGADVFWDRAVAWHVLSAADIAQARRQLRAWHDNTILGPLSPFDIDVRLKAFLSLHRFPTYGYPEFISYLQGVFSGQAFNGRARLNETLYRQTLAEDGHHAYGQMPEEALPDQEDGILRYAVSPVAAAYLRQTILALRARGIKIFFLQSARNEFAAARYSPNLIPCFEAYVQTLARETGLVPLNPGFYTLPPQGFGDDLHLNAHGAFWQTAFLRHQLAANGAGALVYPDVALAPDNFYAVPTFNIGNWVQAQPGATSELVPAPDIAPPALAYPMAGPVVRYSVAGNQPGARLNPPRSLALARGTTYIASIFLKPGLAASAAWRLLFIGGFDGTIAWNFATQSLTYAGMASPLNSGAEICPLGWVRLWVRGATPSQVHGYENAVLQAEPAGTLYAYGAALEPGFYSRNDCAFAP